MKNPDLQSGSALTGILYSDFWGTPLTHSGSHKSYRPLCVLTYRLNAFLHGLKPCGFHLGNIILHAVVTSFFTHLAGRLILANDQCGTRKQSSPLSPSFPVWLAGLLFASHPIHTEAVASVVGRADVLACLFFILTLLAYMRYCCHRNGHHGRTDACVHGKAGGRARRWGWMMVVIVCTMAAMLSKEQAVTVAAVCAMYDVILYHQLVVGNAGACKVFTQVIVLCHLSGVVLFHLKSIHNCIIVWMNVFQMRFQNAADLPSGGSVYTLQCLQLVLWKLTPQHCSILVLVIFSR